MDINKAAGLPPPGECRLRDANPSRDLGHTLATKTTHLQSTFWQMFLAAMSAFAHSAKCATCRCAGNLASALGFWQLGRIFKAMAVQKGGGSAI
ncbi:MAG: hypothetical protein LBF26_02100, partial [Puniceicoccales bacterium]|nr:hypothetical protein [Puniceicoccales bacterium]